MSKETTITESELIRIWVKPILKKDNSIKAICDGVGLSYDEAKRIYEKINEESYKPPMSIADEALWLIQNKKEDL